MNDISRPGNGVVSGVVTDALIDADPPSFWVQWIRWDSGLRRELRINDRITHINGQPLAPMLEPQKTFKGIGQPGESQLWAQMGLKAGDAIELAVLRDDQPVTVRGTLGSDMFYFDREGRAAVAPGGPARLGRDGFATPWSIWEEQIQRAMVIVFTRAWTDRVNTRTEMTSLLGQKARVEHLAAAYPGPFADSMRQDWEGAVELLRGKRPHPAIDLDYREIGRKRAVFAKQEAAKAWQALLAETAAERIPAAPAVSPMARKEAVGKLVALPPVNNDDWFSTFDQVFAAVGSRADGYWFLKLNQPGFHDFFRTTYRFKAMVLPLVKERYQFIARVLDDPWMLPLKDNPTMALMLEPVAGLAGDGDMFVDLRTKPVRFAGEIELSSFSPIERDDSSPASVIEAMIHAVKAGDEAGWRGLFAPWRIVPGKGGKPVVDMSFAADPNLYAAAWDHSRRNIMGDVLDARVARVEKVRRVLAREAGVDDDLPVIDRVIAWVDHYGLFDGEHRTFQNASVNRRWALERLNGGPWRIADIQNL